MADTVTARDVTERIADLLARVEAGEEIVITRDGRRVARLVPDGGAERRRLTPDQQKALAESEAFLSSLKPVPPPPDLPPGWPRNRDELYDDIIASRGRPPR